MFLLYWAVGLTGMAFGLFGIVLGLLGRTPRFIGSGRAVGQAIGTNMTGRLGLMVGGVVIIAAGVMVIKEGSRKHTDSRTPFLAGTKAFQAGEYDKAIEKYNEVLALNQSWDVAPAHQMRARCYYAKQMWSEAAADFAQAREVVDPITGLEFTSALTKLNRYEDALRQYDVLLKRNPNNKSVKEGRESLLPLVPSYK